jgi:putative ABC transport system substrate-binding protein
MKRRRFLLSTLALAGLPKMTAAQSPTKVFRIGWLIGGSAEGSALFLDALRAGLADHGYIEGRNLVIEKRYGEDGPEPVVAALARELAHLPVDVLVTQGYATRTVVKEIAAVPVVYVFSADPILAGIAQSLARPGGNATGISLMSVELNGKRIELLREMLPRLERVTVIANPAHSGANFELEACDNAGRQLGIAVRQVLVRNAAELEESFAEIAAGKPGAITVLPDALVIQKRQRIVEFAAKERIPVISGWKIFAESGALCTYGPRLTESYRRAGFYIDRILKGAKPAELPIERPTVFELVVNLKTANSLGVTVPPSVLARADEVIE